MRDPMRNEWRREMKTGDQKTKRRIQKSGYGNKVLKNWNKKIRNWRIPMN